MEEQIKLLCEKVEDLLQIPPASADCSDYRVKSKVSKEDNNHLETKAEVEKRICDLEQLILETRNPYENFKNNIKLYSLKKIPS